MNFEELKAREPSLVLAKGRLANPVETISPAADPTENSFVFIKNDKILKSFLKTLEAKKRSFANLGAVIGKDFFETIAEDQTTSLDAQVAWLATVDNVDAAMCSLSKPFYDLKYANLNYYVDGRQMGTADVSPDAEIAQNVFIGEGCVIEEKVTIMAGCVLMPNARIKKGTVIFPNATVYPYTVIGENCRIHAQVVIGADGFGYNFIRGEHRKIWHFGGVLIGNNVEIGASSSIDTGTFSPTSIGDGTKIDNFCQIAHNSKIGKHCVLCGRAGLAGSVTLEDYVVIGAGGGCAPGALLREGTQVGAMAVVSENAVWGPKETLGGHPARPLKEWLKNQARLNLLAKKK